jgi:pimeloyl-ACP methyl ester carboxylesterase
MISSFVRFSVAAFIGAALSATAGAAPPKVTPSTITAKTQTVEVDGQVISYRTVGKGSGTPLVLLNRFRGTMDHWDPKLIDRIAAERKVVMFDQPGFARSSGEPPDSLTGFAGAAARVIRALGHRKVDVLGFSMGGTVAIQLVLDQPDLVRRLVIAGSGPGFVPGDVASNAPAGKEIWGVATKPVNTDEDFLLLFFEKTPESLAAGHAYLQRLTRRTDAFEKQVDAKAWQAQLKSAMAVHSPETTLLQQLPTVKHPVLVANGKHDVMVPTYASYAMAQALPDAKLVIYPDSGHGFLFQYPDEFAKDVLDFLR